MSIRKFNSFSFQLLEYLEEISELNARIVNLQMEQESKEVKSRE